MLNSLPDEVLARRERLPVDPDAVTLEGKRVRLVPLDIERDAAALHAVTDGSPIILGDRHVEAYDADALVWRYLFAGPFAALDDFVAYLRYLLEHAHRQAVGKIEQVSGQQVGIACFINNAPRDLKIELGSICYSPIAQRTEANTEATYLMLKHAFGLGYRRLEWKCDARNERSRRSALRMGVQFEGIQEYHMIVKGQSRDTAWFRILDHEWDDVKRHLEALL